MRSCPNCKAVFGDNEVFCPVCGQVYWKAAVEAAGTSSFRHYSAEERMAEYARQSRLSVEMLRARLA